MQVSSVPYRRLPLEPYQVIFFAMHGTLWAISSHLVVLNFSRSPASMPVLPPYALSLSYPLSTFGEMPPPSFDLLLIWLLPRSTILMRQLFDSNSQELIP